MGETPSSTTVPPGVVPGTGSPALELELDDEELWITRPPTTASTTTMPMRGP
jgi:hypothetical protein